MPQLDHELENLVLPESEKPVRQTGPGAMVIFGATGDLTGRKLFPALYNLAASHMLSPNFAVVGVARNDFSEEEFRKIMGEQLVKFATGNVDPDLSNWLLNRLYYVAGEFHDQQTYAKLAQKLPQVDEKHHTGGNYFFYLATSPVFFGDIVEQLGASQLAIEKDGHWRRLVFEKPFGNDLQSARQLNRQIKKVLTEEQIYRIDHYLGKETVQNILVFRFSNGIFEPIWNRRYIDHIQITNGETVGVEQRGGYFDTAGTLRDMVPNHMMQLISLTAMEPPVSFQADAVRDEQAKILKALSPMTDEEVLTRSVRGQYGASGSGDSLMAGYRNELNVPPASRTETYVALKLFIDNWRWADVPFYLRTGKRLPKRITQIVIQFKRAP